MNDTFDISSSIFIVCCFHSTNKNTFGKFTCCCRRHTTVSSVHNIIEAFGKNFKDMAAPEETNEEEVVDANEEEVATSGNAAEEEQGMFCVFQHGLFLYQMNE